MCDITLAIDRKDTYMTNKKNSIRIKDLVSIGVYSALYFITIGISAMLSVFIIPGYSYVFIPVVGALISGSVYMLMVAKVPRFGALSIMGTIMGMFLFIMGRFPGALLISVVCSVIADGVAYAFKYRSKIGMLLTYIVFSFGIVGPVLPMFIFPDIYISELIEQNRDGTYIEGAFANISQTTFAILIIGVIIAGLIGGLFGQKMMKKHFKKAGII